MNNYQLMESFLAYIRQLALDNPTKYMSNEIIYSALIGYNMCDYNKPFENITDKYPYLYQHFKDNPHIHLYEINNFNFLNFQNGRINGNEIKLYAPYDGNHILEAATKIFDFIASRNMNHKSKIAHFTRNDDLVIRVNTLEDSQQIISFINSDPFLSNNLLNVNPFLPNNCGVGMAMDNALSFNFTLCEIIASLIFILKTKNRIFDLNLKTLNAYINECIPNISDLDKKDIYSLLALTTKKDFKLEEFYIHAKEKLKDVYIDNKRIVNPYFYLQRAIQMTDKYYPGQAKQAIIKYVMGNSLEIAVQENVRESLIKYVPANIVMSLIKDYLSVKNIYYSNDYDAIEKYVQNILNKNIIDEQGINDNVNNYIKSPEQYLEDAIKITEKYHPGYGIPALINYVKDDDFVGFTRKENAREYLINNVPSVMVMSIVRNYLEEKNISYVSDYEAIEKYVQNVLGIIKNDNEKLEFNLDYIIEAIKNAYKNTKYKYNQGQAECALRHLLTDGNLLYFTNQFDDRTLLQNISSQYNLKDCIISYLGKEFNYATVDEIIIRMNDIFGDRKL